MANRGNKDIANGDTVIEFNKKTVVRTSDGETVVIGPAQDENTAEQPKIEAAPQIVGWLEIFRFATRFDIFLMIFGAIAGIAHGSIMPTITIMYGEVIAGLSAPKGCNGSQDDTALDLSETFVEDMVEYVLYYVMAGCALFVLGFIQATTWSIAAENQTSLIRRKYFRSLLRQDIGWYDTQSTGLLTSKFNEDIVNFQNGIGDKVAVVFQYLGNLIAGVVVGLITGWELCLVLLALCPLIGVLMFVMIKVMTSYAQRETAAYAKAGSIAQEVLNAVRTVTAFGGQEHEVSAYGTNLDEARKVGTKKGLMTGLLVGITFLITFSAYGVGFTYGVILIGDPNSGYTIAKVLTTFFAVLLGTSQLGMSGMSFQMFSGARAAAYHIFQIIERVPTIDAFSTQGHKPTSADFRGHVELKSVKFAYPTRPDVPVLKGVDLTIEPGKTVALVGASGCGKSTIISLIQRFYDPQAGSVLIDGRDVREYNIFALRHLFGVVGQEPVLFEASIADNIRLGCPSATQADIENAARMANAHDFIQELPERYNTQVLGGGKLSGGQKQRIAIARAIIRNPRILLLDEATSALDSQSEAIVQDALERARHGRTTIVIAHRLSTVVTADKILVFQAGLIVESGTHAQLVAQGGVYAKLVDDQNGQAGEQQGSAQDHRKALAGRRHSGPKSPTTKGGAVEDEEEDATKVAAKPSTQFSMIRLWKLSSPEWYLYVVGILASIVAGAIWPAFSVLFTQAINAFSECKEEDRQAQGLLYSLLLFAVGGACLISQTLLWSTLSMAGERLVQRIRVMTLDAMLKQEIGWFDEKDNAVGALTSRLSTKAAAVKDGTGPQFGSIVQTVVSLATAVVIAFIYSWQIALVVFAFLPIVVIASSNIQKDNSNKHMEQASKVLVEATSNIKTVTSLGNYTNFHKQFTEPIAARHKSEMPRLYIGGILFASYSSSVLFGYAAAFYVGTILIADGTLTFEDMFTPLTVIMFSIWYAVGQVNSTYPNLINSRKATAELFELFDRKPAITWYREEGQPKRLVPTSCAGRVDANRVKFSYPTRPNQQILNNFALAFPAGQTIAVVGPSGSGKSTIIQLLLRFYDSNEGSVTLDGNDIRSLDLIWLRRQMSLVSQEPILFDRSIAENIAYGVIGRVPSSAEIEAVARQANAANFISALPEGYNTRVGEKGAQLSGGQKQRIAIARALLRNPRILLLDEATSALDTESERFVQVALDRARLGRTTIVIAHRLATIESADVIAFIKGGVVRELGSHSELMQRRGEYYSLKMAQQLS